MDRVVCADVFVNIGDLNLCHQYIAEMAHVVVDGGKFMVATMNDGSVSKEAFNKRIQEYMATLPDYEEDPELVIRKWMPWHHKVLTRFVVKSPGLSRRSLPSSRMTRNSSLKLARN